MMVVFVHIWRALKEKDLVCMVWYGMVWLYGLVSSEEKRKQFWGFNFFPFVISNNSCENYYVRKSVMGCKILIWPCGSAFSCFFVKGVGRFLMLMESRLNSEGWWWQVNLFFSSSLSVCASFRSFCVITLLLLMVIEIWERRCFPGKSEL